MDILIQALHKHGHTIDVVRSSKSWYIKEESAYYNAITVSVTEGFDKKFMKDMLSLVFDIETGKISGLNLIKAQLKLIGLLKTLANFISNMTATIFEDENMMKMLKEKNYDLMLTDPAWGIGVMLAHYLNLPVVYNVRWIPSGEGHLEIAPSPLSYVPMTGSGHSNRMTFIQRVKNVIIYLVMEVQYRLFTYPAYKAVCDRYLGPHVDFHALLQGADIWLMRVDYVFEFPRPTMPNVIYVGGFQCQEAKPLPQDLEDFVQSSGEHGFIIMSIGTFVDELPSERAEEVAAAFAQLPQKVIWRHKGERPSSLGNNTLLVDWMPQNDLLGHPKIRAFVAHGGTNGVQEALFHGVPVVGLPLYFDQYDNLLRLRDRGGAKLLSLGTLDRNVFLESLQDVLHDPAYRENMQRLSKLHRDKPMKPMDSALFWIEFVMRHKGAAHLKSESYRMPWYIYHSVDVIAFLLFAVCLVFGMMFVLMKCVWRTFCKRKPKQD
ncbi:UDP-glucuronosyltransferase 2C1-like isoform X2 [Salminus brasiliensis]|uniref:UDP-glucuronosyltransferase 2C1-like isoform X2 n=1 Tax=Salminus brasiliensis TaxID=930266 RepID=UPI003B8374B1